MAVALHWVDILIIVLYFCFVLGVGLWSSFKVRGGGVSGYFLASRGMNWILVGGSLFGSNIGSEHFVGLAGSGAASGIAISGFELNAMFVIVVLGWLFLPVYITSGVYTMPEYLKKRFGGKRIRVYLSVIALLLSIFTKIAADLFAGSIFIKQALDWDLYGAIGLQLLIAGISTISGGLTAVMWTDTLQVIIMVSGAMVLMIIAFYEIGGYPGLINKYFEAIPQQNYTVAGVQACAGVPPEYSFNLLRSIDSDLPWPGMIFGLCISAVWYWCSDQVIVQKALSSKNYSHAKAGCILTGFLKFLPMWLMVFPGMIARALYPDEVACTNPTVCQQVCFSKNGCTNVAYPLLVIRLLPIGLRGIMIAVLMSAIMSSLSSIFNSSSTIFTMDIWKTLRPRAKELELLIVGRLFVLFMVGVAVLWIPVIAAYPNSQLFNYVQSVTSYLAPPICATFVLAIFVPRSNEQGAFWGLIVGLCIGMTRFIMEICYGAPTCSEVDTRPDVLTKVHYLHFGILLFVIVCIVNILVSLFTKPINKKHLYRLTYWTRYSDEDRISLTDHVIEKVEPPSSANINGKADVPNDDDNVCAKIKKLMMCICGLNKQSEAEQMQQSEDKISLHENPTARIITNVLALVLVTSGIFVYTFWA